MTKKQKQKKLSDLRPLRQVQVSDMKPLYCPGGSSAAPAPHTAVASGSPAPAPWKHKKVKKKNPIIYNLETKKWIKQAEHRQRCTYFKS